MSDPHRRPLVVTASGAVLESAVRLAAAAHTEVDVAVDGAEARPRWPTAPVVVVDADAVPTVMTARLARRPGVIVVAPERAGTSVYADAVAVGAERVVVLPDDEQWLVRRIGDAADPQVSAASVVAVLGGRGGAGATTMAVALALTARRLAHPTLLIDADPLGGGIDLTLGGEHVAGLRWPGLSTSSGRMSPVALREALPVLHDVAVLSWDRGDDVRSPTAEGMSAVFEAACRGGGIVVVDLPRHLDDVASVVLERAGLTLLVTPAELRATAAAQRILAAVGSVAADVRLVVRGPAPAGLTAKAIAGALGIPLAGELRAERGLAESLERGEPPGRRVRGPLARLCRDVVADLVPPVDRFLAA